MIIEVAVEQLPDRYSKDLIQYRKCKDVTQLTCYHRMQEFGNKGYPYWKDLTKDDIKKDILNFIRLYKKIKLEGWKEEPYLKGEIFEDGSWKIKSGYHRISILKYLKYKTVKVDWTMHPEFEKFYNVVNRRYKKNRMYQNISHIIFSNWSCVRGKNRWALINQNIPSRSKILDIGSYLGDISLNLGIKRHSVRGIEADSNLVWASNYLVKSHQNRSNRVLKVEFINMNIINYFQNNQDKYNVIIMLSVDRWIRDNYGKGALIKLFQDIAKRCNIFIFESRGKHEKIGLRLLKKHTGFKNIQLLGKDDGETHRNLWKLWK